jgi:long-chain acyl-CoA synthetase
MTFSLLTDSITDLATLAQTSLDSKGAHTALIFEGSEFSNAAILVRSRRLQTAFSELGLAQDEIALVCMVNDPLVHSVFLAGFRCGAVLTPVMPQLAVPELEYIIQHTEARGMITDVTKLDAVREAAAESTCLEWIVVSGGTTDETRTPREYSIEDLLTSDPALDSHTRARDDVALMLYTSGTTGRPKGVMLTHGNLLASAETLVEAAELHLREHPMRSITPLPMAHIFGISLMTVDFMIPATYAPGYLIQERKFDPVVTLSQIQEYKCTDLSVVPTMMSVLLNHPDFDRYDLSSLFKVDVGGAPMAVELAEQWQSRVGCHVRQRYGMTENAGKGSTDRTSEAFHPGSVGRPYHCTPVKIVNGDGETLPPGERGEILTSGPVTMKGYYKDPEATANTIVDGWLHSGDIGYLSEDGWLYVVDRAKDLVIKGGENIYPAELENILYRHPDVADAAVVGIPHDTYGEEPVAFVVLRPGASISSEDLVDFARTQIAPFKAPNIIHFCDILPKSGVGKILRRELRATLLSQNT